MARDSLFLFVFGHEGNMGDRENRRLWEVNRSLTKS